MELVLGGFLMAQMTSDGVGLLSLFKSTGMGQPRSFGKVVWDRHLSKVSMGFTDGLHCSSLPVWLSCCQAAMSGEVFSGQ